MKKLIGDVETTFLNQRILEELKDHITEDDVEFGLGQLRDAERRILKMPKK